MWKLVIGNKRYSSWSMRPWMVMRAFDIPFEEVVIPLRLPDSKARVLDHSPSGRVPALWTPDITIPESMAIIEFVAERFPAKDIWPKNWAARAHARAISNEMHGGFMPLRQGCPMDIAARYATPEMTDILARDIRRIEDIWTETRSMYGGAGPFLFGAFSAADAMFAPVVSRFDSFQIPVSDETRDYMAAIMAHPAYAEWRAAALLEPWTIPDYAAGHVCLETYTRTQEMPDG